MPDTAPDASAPAAVPSAVPSVGSAGSVGSALEDGATEGRGSKGCTGAEGAPDTAPVDAGAGARVPDTALEPMGGDAPWWAPDRYSARAPPVPPPVPTKAPPVPTKAPPVPTKAPPVPPPVPPPSLSAVLSMHVSPAATSAAPRAAPAPETAPETVQLQLPPLLTMAGEALGAGVD